MRRVTVGLSLLVILGCTSPTEPLSVVAIPPTLKLSNPSDATVYHFIVEREYAASINWTPCVNPVTCTGVAPHSTSTIPYESIGGYSPNAKEAIVYWWYLEPLTGSRFKVDSVRATVVQL